jgi:hypothetical protein
MITFDRPHRTARLRTTTWLAGLLAVTCLVAPAQAQETRAQHESRLVRERAACLSGQSHQDTQTCLQEVRAARAEARRGGLESDSASYARNQLLRCDPLSGSEKQDCIARIQGRGTAEGSVEGGGILRKRVTREVVPAPAAAAASAASSAPSR